MKRCPRCHQTYTDDELNFCLNDGEFLTAFENDLPPTIFGAGLPRFPDDAPPTVLLNTPRITNQTSWQPGPIEPWQGQSPNIQNQPYGMPGFVRSRDQTLPTISLILGVFSIVLICCYGGIWLGIPAAIVGYIGMRNADGDPNRYGGRGMAIGGMVLGIVSFLMVLGWFVVILLGLLAG